MLGASSQRFSAAGAARLPELLRASCAHSPKLENGPRAARINCSCTAQWLLKANPHLHALTAEQFHFLFVVFSRCATRPIPFAACVGPLRVRPPPNNAGEDAVSAGRRLRVSRARRGVCGGAKKQVRATRRQLTRPPPQQRQTNTSSGAASRRRPRPPRPPAGPSCRPRRCCARRRLRARRW